VNEHVPSDDKRDDSKYSFYEELEPVFDNFPKCHVKILSGDFNIELESWE
jgi:exonuclease III